MIPILAELFKKVPVLCWALVTLCALMYTTTICYVMLRSSAVNVTIDGMTMEMTRAAATQSSTADDLDAAAKTIADLKAQIEVLKTAAASPLRPQPAPIVTQVVAPLEEVRDDLKSKATKLRESSQQIQQQIQRGQQQQQQQQR